MLFALFALSAFCADYENTIFDYYIETSDKSFYNPESITFRAGWTSTNDTIETPTLTLNNDTSQTADQKFYNITGISFSGVEDFYVEGGASVSINDATLNIGSRVRVQGVHSYGGYASQLFLKNCETRISATSRNSVGEGASMIVEGGTFTVLNGASSVQTFAVSQGSSLTFRDANVDFSGVELATRTNNGYATISATINVENSTFTAGYVDLYGYVSAMALPVLNITKGSKVTMSLEKTYSAYDWSTGEFYDAVQYMRGGTINVSGTGSVLNLTSSLIQADTIDLQVYTSSINVSDGAKADIAGIINLSAVEVNGGSIEADSIVVGVD